MDQKNYSVMEQFDEGGFGEIYFVTQGQKLYALKQIRYRGKLEDDPYILGEIQSLSMLKHENIIKLHDVVITPREVNIIMEYADGGNLETFVQEVHHGILSESMIHGFFYQILCGVRHCHDNGYAHRDLTPSNILLTQECVIKLADFGLAIKARDQKGNVILCHDFLGNNSYLSPEVLSEIPYDPILSDVWSLGITLYFMLYGKEPYKGTVEDVLYQQEHGSLFPMTKTSHSSETLQHLVIFILKHTPEKRPSVANIIGKLSTNSTIKHESSRFVEPNFVDLEMCDDMFLRQV